MKMHDGDFLVLRTSKGTEIIMHEDLCKFPKNEKHEIVLPYKPEQIIGAQLNGAFHPVEEIGGGWVFLAKEGNTGRWQA